MHYYFLAAHFLFFFSDLALAKVVPDDIVSALMWQPSKNFVSFPGVPAFLDSGDAAVDRKFRIEIYFKSQALAEDLGIQIRVLGLGVKWTPMATCKVKSCVAMSR